MAKKKWFLLGLLGATVGMVMKLVRGRRAEQMEAGRWDAPKKEDGSQTS